MWPARGAHGVDRIAGLPGKVIAVHSVVGFGVADDRLDGWSSPQRAFDLLGDAPLLTRDVNLEAMRRRRVVAAIAAIGDDVLEIDADKTFDLGNDGGERVAPIGFPCKALA